MHFDADYREELKLDDGTRVRLRLIRPSDRAQIAEGFAHLSDETRYLRFFARKEALTDDELRYLTEIDQVHHFALGAAALEGGEEGEGLGVARFIELREHVAEAAVVVADAMQGRGLGRILFQRLVAAAVERGIERFRCDVLASNEAMRGMVAEFAPEAEQARDGEVITIEWPLPRIVPEDFGTEVPRENPLYRLMVMAARRLVVVRQLLFGEPSSK